MLRFSGCFTCLISKTFPKSFFPSWAEPPWTYCYIFWARVILRNIQECFCWPLDIVGTCFSSSCLYGGNSNLNWLPNHLSFTEYCEQLCYCCRKLVSIWVEEPEVLFQHVVLNPQQQQCCIIWHLQPLGQGQCLIVISTIHST